MCSTVACCPSNTNDRDERNETEILASVCFLCVCSPTKQICPGLNANEMHALYNKHHKVSSLIKVHLNTHNFVKYAVV